MKDLITAKASPTTMSSVELVEYINSLREKGEPEVRHDNLMAKVPKVLGESHAPKFLGTQTYGNNNSRSIYNFPKREACLVATPQENTSNQSNRKETKRGMLRGIEKVGNLERYYARCMFKGVRYQGEIRDTQEEAHQDYVELHKKLHGQYSNYV